MTENEKSELKEEIYGVLAEIVESASDGGDWLPASSFVDSLDRRTKMEGAYRD